jgi:Short C-terminal domain
VGQRLRADSGRPAEVQTRSTATRLAVLGPLALAFKKEKNSACFIAVEGRFGQFVVEVKKKSVYQLRAELAPGYLKCQACGNFIPPRSRRCSRCGLRVGETPAAEAATGIADQLAQLAELHGAGALTDEEFVVAKQALLSPSIKP